MFKGSDIMKELKIWYMIALFAAIGIIAFACYVYFGKGESSLADGTMVKGFMQKCKDTLV